MSIQDFGNQEEEEDFFPTGGTLPLLLVVAHEKTWLECLFSSISIYFIRIAFELIFIVVTQAPHHP